MKAAELERRQAHPQQLEVVLHLDPELSWFRGHFAVQPLLPGVAQIDWVMHYASYQRHDGDARHTASSGKISLCR